MQFLKRLTLLFSFFGILLISRSNSAKAENILYFSPHKVKNTSYTISGRNSADIPKLPKKILIRKDSKSQKILKTIKNQKIQADKALEKQMKEQELRGSLTEKLLKAESFTEEDFLKMYNLEPLSDNTYVQTKSSDADKKQSPTNQLSDPEESPSIKQP
ncbi:MAG: hypothetical protein GX221_02015 [Candidatus Riflebacteria bacterium]|nr:hypothetical protein [Candidatus Riflebacteria bacterium]